MFKVFAILAALAGFVAPAMAEPALQHVTIATAGVGMYYITEYVAEDAGFFAHEGLQVDVAEVGSGTRQAAAIMGGSAELSAIGIEHLLDSAGRGGNLIAISSCYDAFPMTITLSNDAIKRTGIEPSMSLEERVKRLKGLHLAITSPGSSTDQFVRTLFLARGMKPDDMVKLQPVSAGAPMLAALEQGSVDGFVWSSPYPEIAAAKGVGHVVIDPMSGDVPEFADVPYLTLATSADTLAAKRPLLLAAVRAYQDAIRLLHQDPDKARAAIRHRFATMDDAQYNEIFNRFLRGVPESTTITEDQVRRAQTTLNLIERKPLDVKYTAVFSPDLAAQAAREASAK
jgi:NitT/TauT family transport system substrate-binding protein